MKGINTENKDSALKECKYFPERNELIYLEIRPKLGGGDKEKRRKKREECKQRG